MIRIVALPLESTIQQSSLVSSPDADEYTPEPASLQQDTRATGDAPVKDHSPPERNPMSVTRSDGTKIVLPRTGPDPFWDAINSEFDPDDDRTWRYLAMLALRENCGWPVDRIGRAFGHSKGHITRCIDRIKEKIRDRFHVDDLWSDPVDRSNPPNA